MEGLIPFVYKAVMQYKSGKDVTIGSWFNESPSYSYMKLPGDSGRFQGSASSLFGSDFGFSASSSSAAHVVIASEVQSPIRRKTPRRVSS